MIANSCAILFILVAAKLSDRISAKIAIPAALIFQIGVMVMYTFCQDPTSWYAYFCAVPQAGSTMVYIVFSQSYIAKRCPKMIRGTIYAVIGMVGNVGMIVYSELGNLFF